MCKPISPTGTLKEPTKIPKDAPRQLLNLWRSIYVALPVINFPGTTLNIAFTLVSTIFLTSVRLASLWAFANVLEYDVSSAKEASGGISSIVHSTILCPGLLSAFLAHKSSPAEHRNKAPQWWVESVDAMLQFCTGYMLYDICFILWTRIEPGSLVPQVPAADYMFMAHHLMTIFYMTQNRVYEAGHTSAMLCMFWGELSNPLQNGYLVSGVAMEVGKGNAFLHFIIETVFSVVYFTIRAMIAPILFIPVSYNLLFSKTAKENLSVPVRIFWVILMWGVLGGSIPWIEECYGNIKTNFGLDEWAHSPSEL